MRALIRFILNNILLLTLPMLFGAGYFLTCTTSGFQTDIRYLAKIFPALHIQQGEGKLFSEFTLKNISYQDANTHIQIQSLTLNWNPVGLFGDKFVIENAIVDDPHIQFLTTQSSSETNLHWLQYIIAKKFTVHHLVIQSQDTKINFDGTLAQQWDATWQINIPHVNVFEPSATGAFSSTGKLSGPRLTPIITATFQGKKLSLASQSLNAFRGNMNFNVNSNQNSTLVLSASGIEINKHKLAKLDLDMTGRVIHQQQELLANLTGVLMKANKFSAQISLPKFTNLTDLSQPIAGKIKFSTEKLAPLANLIPQIKNLHGDITGELALNGTLTQPTFTSDLYFKNGRFTIPELNITIEALNLHGQSTADNVLHYQGNFKSGKGTAQLQGNMDVAKDDMPVTLEIHGENLKVLNLDQYKITASPDLTLTFSKNNLTIEGNILIPSAEVTPKSFDKMATLPEEVVFVDQSKPVTALPFASTLQINLQLGDNIHIVYDDLQTNLTGNLHISKNTNNTATATGELRAHKGTYFAFGQTFTIQEGRLLFAGGPLINPGLNIRASRPIKTISVSSTSQFGNTNHMYTGTEMITMGVLIEGTFDKPNISLFSSPSGLSQNDIMSYLLFGYPQSQVSTQDKKNLISAMSVLKLGGKTPLNKITDKVQNSLGLSELNVEATEVFNPTTGAVDSTTSFVVGKQLAPSLYAHYSIGLFNPISIFNLHYQISKRFALQSETSTIDNGADLLYSIERD